MLYIVATPIGNLEDITLRALRILREVDLIACEDTRHTRNLLTHYEISTPTVSYHEHNERERTDELIAKLESGLNIALVSDAGTPLISDPGFRLVAEAIRRRLSVVPVPGAVALITALSASSLPVSDFLFLGFLPPKPAARRAKLKEFAGLQTTLILYEAPHRLKPTLETLLETLGDRHSVIARELTKLHEEFLRGRISELLEQLRERDLKGEFVLLIAPPDENAPSDAAENIPSISAQVAELMRLEGLDLRQALKRVAKAGSISRSEAYRRLLSEKE